VNVYVSEPQAGFVQSFQLREGRQIYFICIEGGIKVNGVQLGARDAARITSVNSTALELEAGPDGAHMCVGLPLSMMAIFTYGVFRLFIEMPKA
jgi:hypothetical protein